ncbi:MAG: DUF6266 family protein [Methylococcaceae bacterium]
MAKFVNGILGGFSGKVGTIIGACWNGIDYMRGLATSITNPKTLAQQEQRAKFSLIIAFLRPLTAFLRLGFKSAALKMSAFNAAMAYNVKNAVKGLFPAFEIDYTKVLVAKGPLAGILNPHPTSVTPGQLNLTWDDNMDEAYAMGDDRLYIVVINPLLKKAVSVIADETRLAGTGIVTLPEAWSGNEVECYAGFTNASESLISDSYYAGKVAVA